MTHHKENTEKVGIKTLDLLFDESSIHAVQAVENADGQYELIAETGKGRQLLLHTKLGHVRTFADLDRLIRYCQSKGMCRVEVLSNEKEPEAA